MRLFSCHSLPQDASHESFDGDPSSPLSTNHTNHLLVRFAARLSPYSVRIVELAQALGDPVDHALPRSTQALEKYCHGDEHNQAISQ